MLQLIYQSPIIDFWQSSSTQENMKFTLNGLALFVDLSLLPYGTLARFLRDAKDGWPIDIDSRGGATAHTMNSGKFSPYPRGKQDIIVGSPFKNVVRNT